MKKDGLAIHGSILTWLAITCGIITMFSNFQTIVNLADWARIITSNWGDFLNWGWSHVFQFFKIEIHVTAQFQITMAIVMISMAIGAFLTNSFDRKEKWPIKISNVFRINILIAILLYCFATFLANNVVSYINWQEHTVHYYTLFLYSFYVVYGLSIFVGVCHWPMKAAITATFSAIFFSIVFQTAAESIPEFEKDFGSRSMFIGAGFSIIAAMLTLLIAPPMQFAKRLVFLLLGIFILLGLNEVSKLKIDLTPNIEKFRS